MSLILKEQKTESNVGKYRVKEIDLLRFLAALSVVFFHYTFRGYAADSLSIMPYPFLAPIFKYGYLGVELFFMISGFVVLMTASKGGLREFFVSRVVRLYPAFWACCTITFIFSLLMGGGKYVVTINQYLINMTMLSGFLGVPAIDGAYWSLLVEMKFYFLIAVILAFKKIEKIEFFLFFWLISSVLLNVDVIPFVKLSKIMGFILITDYSAYFIAGAVFFIVWLNGLSRIRVFMIFSSFLLALYQSVSKIENLINHYHVNINPYIVISIVSVFFTVMFLVSIKKMGFFGRKDWLTLGVLTYPLYLIHQNIGYMIFNASYPAFNSHILVFGTVIFMVIFAYLIHIKIERNVAVLLKGMVL